MLPPFLLILLIQKYEVLGLTMASARERACRLATKSLSVTFPSIRECWQNRRRSTDLLPHPGTRDDKGTQAIFSQLYARSVAFGRGS